MFDVDQFVADCYVALKEHSPQAAVKELMERTMSRPDEVEAALGTPTIGELATLHRSPELTVLKVIWTPGMSFPPHNHRMWAVIGIYGGQEDNTFYRRSSQGLVLAGGKQLESKDSVALGDKVIHAVRNPRQVFTGAIHVYGGDFFAAQRSEWDPETFEERLSDGEKARLQFKLANDRYLAEQAALRATN
jgi:predicted metal-dependent enzyme (double-stranded beta helix superfamily)